MPDPVTLEVLIAESVVLEVGMAGPQGPAGPAIDPAKLNLGAVPSATANGRKAVLAAIADGLLPANPERPMLWGQRLRPALNSRRQITSASFRYALLNQFVGTPHFVIRGARFCFPNWFARSDGVDEIEQGTGNSLNVMGATVWQTDTLVGALSFEGTPGVAIQDMDAVWSDPLAAELAAGLPVHLRIHIDRPIDSYWPAGYLTQPQNGEAWRYSGNSLATLLTSGTVQDNSGSDRVNAYGAIMAVGKGWTGQPVCLIHGDSISATDGQSNAERIADNHGCRTVFSKALDSLGWHFGNMAVPGTTPTHTSGQPGHFALRKAAIDKLPIVPFTHLLCTMGVNGATADAEAWWDRMQAMWQQLQDWWPQVPIIQTTLPPRTGQVDDDFWQTAEGQIPAGDARTTINQRIISRPAPLAGVIDMAPAWMAPGTEDRWAGRSFTATLLAPVMPGSTSFSLSAAPPIGEVLVFEPGTGEADQAVNVVEVSGTGPFLVTTIGACTKAHSADTAVHAKIATDTPIWAIHPSAAWATDTGAPWMAGQKSQFF